MAWPCRRLHRQHASLRFSQLRGFPRRGRRLLPKPQPCRAGDIRPRRRRCPGRLPGRGHNRDLHLADTPPARRRKARSSSGSRPPSRPIRDLRTNRLHNRGHHHLRRPRQRRARPKRLPSRGGAHRQRPLRRSRFLRASPVVLTFQPDNSLAAQAIATELLGPKGLAQSVSLDLSNLPSAAQTANANLASALTQVQAANQLPGITPSDARTLAALANSLTAATADPTFSFYVPYNSRSPPKRQPERRSTPPSQTSDPRLDPLHPPSPPGHPTGSTLPYDQQYPLRPQ